MSSQEYKSYNAWDRGTRLFHWVNVLCILILMVLGLLILNGGDYGLGGEFKISMKVFHTLVGYIFVANLVWRIIWGFIGGPNARWRKILPGGKGYGADLKSFVAAEKSDNPEYYKAHNPVGRIMVTLLILLCISQAVTGLVVAGTDIYFPPFGSMIAEWIAATGIDPSTLVAGTKDGVDPDAYKEMRAFRSPYIAIHIYGFYTLAGFITLHIISVIRAEVKQGGGLISAMFTGKKVLPKEPVDK